MRGSTAHNVYLLIHTMTITDSDFVVEAQFFHTFLDDLSNARLLARRVSLRIHPSLGTARRKLGLQMIQAPSLRTLMKRNSANIKHHLRTIHIGPQNSPNSRGSPSRFDSCHRLQEQPSLLQQPSTLQDVVTERKHSSPVKETFDDQLAPEASPEETTLWLNTHRFEKYLHTFSNFSGADMLRMSRDDLIQICGHADGIRLYNILHSKTIAPKLKIYVCREKSSLFNAIFLSAHSNLELMQKLAALIGVSQDRVQDLYMEGPHSIHIQMNNDVIRHIKEDTMFSLEIMQDNGNYIFLLKQSSLAK